MNDDWLSSSSEETEAEFAARMIDIKNRYKQELVDKKAGRKVRIEDDYQPDDYIYKLSKRDYYMAMYSGEWRKFERQFKGVFIDEVSYIKDSDLHAEDIKKKDSVLYQEKTKTRTQRRAAQSKRSPLFEKETYRRPK